ncbi:alpha/beta hydrolase [Enterococcus sp. AZ109]|uniref:alpha/beta hydrolase n=1 Tax=Enterococcus sp. AZ109 TaxID=2774634 RepID=UPI003F25FD6A
MKKLTQLTVGLLCLSFLLSACSENESNSSEELPATNSEQTTGGNNMEQIGYTEAVPNNYLAPAENQGEVVRINYDTYNYADGGDKMINKPANVYLPYGYDENDNTQYNIFYFMHGWTGNADSFFSAENGATKNILDHLIANGEMVPTIVVAATFDEFNEGADFSRSVEELTVFHQELANELIPAVEGQFHTYAKSTDAAGQQASRDHRAFGGFSLGAVTTWYTFIHNLDAFRYYLPMSGDSWVIQQYGGRNQPMATAEYLQKVAEESPYGLDGFYIYAATGTQDAVFDQVDGQMQAMLELPETFNEENFVYNWKRNGRHDFEAVNEYLYNALPIFFPNE